VFTFLEEAEQIFLISFCRPIHYVPGIVLKTDYNRSTGTDIKAIFIVRPEIVVQSQCITEVE